MPSLRYVVGLNAPGLNIIGAGEPALPGVSLGHNADIAWGLTIFAIDQEDLYVYDLNPANPRQYRYKDGWEDMRVVHEAIPVKGAEIEATWLPPFVAGVTLRANGGYLDARFDELEKRIDEIRKRLALAY